VASSANKTPKKLFLKKIKKDIKKAKYMLLSKLLKKLQNNHAQKVIDKNVMEKCTFSTFPHVHQIGFLITFCECIFLHLFQQF
jgi:hypothetical protein